MNNNTNVIAIDNTDVLQLTAQANLMEMPAFVVNSDLKQITGRVDDYDLIAALIYLTGLSQDVVRKMVLDGVLPGPRALDTIASKTGCELLVEAVPVSITSGTQRFCIYLKKAGDLHSSLQELVLTVARNRDAQKEHSLPIVKRRLAKACAGNPITTVTAQTILQDFGMRLQIRMVPRSLCRAGAVG